MVGGGVRPPSLLAGLARLEGILLRLRKDGEAVPRCCKDAWAAGGARTITTRAGVGSARLPRDHAPSTAEGLRVPGRLWGRQWSSSTPRAATVAEAHNQRARKKASEQARYWAALVALMIGGTYASVPLYRMFCQATGFGGTTKRAEALEDKLAAGLEEGSSEDTPMPEIVVTFNADVAEGMQWTFRPAQRAVRTAPGESTLAFYTVKNLSSRPLTGVSTYNVSPQKAGAHFNKIQCFCFEEQRLRAGEEIDMPVFFYIDRAFASDPAMKGIRTLTLSYTFFKVDEGEEGDEEG